MISAREHLAIQDRPLPDAPPFLPGDLIVSIDHPGSGAVTVEVMIERGRGNWRVGYRRAGGVTGSAQADTFVKAPVGWEDKPPYPTGSLRFGLSEADRQIAIANDAANPDLQDARMRWREAVVEWNEKWGNHPDILAAKESRR